MHQFIYQVLPNTSMWILKKKQKKKNVIQTFFQLILNKSYTYIHLPVQIKKCLVFLGNITIVGKISNSKVKLFTN